MASTLPAAVQTLIERYAENRETYESGSYNETHTRRDFIDPLFMALGWDVDNSEGYSEAYRDVIHEDAIKVGGSTKAPDYSFRIGKERKFFVEAKKPGVNIKTDKLPAYQLRRYAWSTKLPLSILTDFQEWAIYDGRVKPSQTDAPSKARIDYFTFEQLEEKWDFLVSTFSKEAILKGAFDKYAQGSKNKRGTSEVDSAFLQEIEQWRELLAKNIAKNNSGLSQRELNFAVQRTIDRILFLRICESRGVEPHGELLGISGGTRLYPRLVERFHRADERYNSGLFHFTPEAGRNDPPDDLTPDLTIDDKPLKDILSKLYYPECPYEFSVLPADILGQVYEQFLGKTIRLTPSHRAIVEEKPEVRKAGGVYYTPTYIVDYIVQHTVGKLVEGKTPQQVGAMTAAYKPSKSKTAQPITVLDPACGSGSFLLGAYQFLLDWYTEQYIADGPANHTKGKEPRLFQHSSGAHRLTTSERKRILLTHIYGVDIDSQAVETTKLSLLLKVLEGETTESIDSQMKMFHTRALPDLSSNIKCGNSLVAPDFYQGKQHTLFDFDEEQQIKINVFDWNEEFKEIMQAGGFDAVIGNPPYIFARNGGFEDNIKQYYYAHFQQSNYQLNTFVLFTEKGLSLLNPDGVQGYIIPNNWLTISTMKPFRDFLLTHSGSLCIVNNLFRVFPGANVDTSVFTLSRNKGNQTVSLFESHVAGEMEHIAEVAVPDMMDQEIVQFRIFKDRKAYSVLQNIGGLSQPLSDYATVKAGLKAYEIGKGTPSQTKQMKELRVYHSRSRESSDHRKYLEGRDVQRYAVGWSGRFLQYGRNLAAPRKAALFDGDRILVRQIPSRPPYCINACIVEGEELNDINSMVIHNDSEYRLEYLLGVLNSRLISYWFVVTFDKFQRKTFPQFKVNELARFPIVPPKQTKHDQMVTLVEQLLELHKRLPEASGQSRTLIERNIAATDKQIDQLVYQLYGLSEEEIALVESSLAD